MSCTKAIKIRNIVVVLYLEKWCRRDIWEGKQEEVFTHIPKFREQKQKRIFVIVQDEIEIRRTIRTFVLASAGIPELDDNDDLYDSGIVNSLFAVQLITFLEK